MMDEKDNFSIEKEIDIVSQFLNDAKRDIQKLMRLMEDMKNTLGKPTKEQLEKWDKVINDYMFFEEDTDVNGQRVKKISKSLIERAKSSGVEEEIIKEFSAKETWKFNW